MFTYCTTWAACAAVNRPRPSDTCTMGSAPMRRMESIRAMYCALVTRLEFTPLPPMRIIFTFDCFTTGHSWSSCPLNTCVPKAVGSQAFWPAR